MNYLDLIGIVLNFIGSIILVWSQIIITKRDALNLGVGRWASDNDEQNLNLPQVKNILRQRNLAIEGTSFIAIGFFIQLLSIISF